MVLGEQLEVRNESELSFDNVIKCFVVVGETHLIGWIIFSPFCAAMVAYLYPPHINCLCVSDCKGCNLACYAI